jgi:hypothetical protein
MAATQDQIDDYITDIRSAVADFGNKLAIKQKIGNQDIYCDRVKLMMLSCFLDCMYDYLLQYPDDTDPDDTNFFTTDEIRDVQQHINNICGTFYIITL